MIEEKYLYWLEQSIKKNWGLPALSNYEKNTITYRELAERIIWLHYIFKKCGIKRGDKIAVIGRNSVNWAITYLATISYGAVIVPVLPDFKAEDVQHIVNHSDAVLFFAAKSIYEDLDEKQMPALTAIISLKDFSLYYTQKPTIKSRFKTTNNDYLDDFDSGLTPNNFQLPDISNEELASIVYTSGTTGFSKGVMLNHNSLSANVRFAQKEMPLQAGNKMVSFMPLAHMYGCSFEFLFPLTLGCHITFLDKIPSPKIIVKAFMEIRPELILSVPLIIEKIYKKQIQPTLSRGIVNYLIKIPLISKAILKKVRTRLFEVFGGRFREIVIGGSALNPQVEDFLRKIDFPFTIGYGMTECGPLISYSPWDKTKPYSVGQPVDTLEVRVDSSDPQNEVGEIQVRGENVMLGYYKNPEATADALDADGWLHTGDLGILDEDGLIFLKGRSKFMILGPSGQNIYPEEIEARLNNMEYVAEALVLDKAGKLVALIYPDYEAIDATGISDDELEKKIEENRQKINEVLPAYSAITKIDLFPNEFEKTPTKKIKRFLYNV